MELWIAGFHLLAFCPLVVGKEIASPVLDSPVDKSTEICSGFFQSVFAVHDMEVEDDADIRLLRPG